jgi:hypothetical protein
MRQPNISFDGSPVQFRLDSPLLVCLDPFLTNFVREEMSALPPETRADIRTVLLRMNGSLSVMSCYQIPDFRPGLYTLDPREIRKFGYDDEDSSYDEEGKEENDPTIDPMNYQFVGTDTAAIVIADFAHLFELVEQLTWERYDLSLRGDVAVFEEISNSLGGPYFAVISGVSLPGMEFDGDGTYTLRAGAIRRCS